MTPAKGIGAAPELDGSDLRVAIIHARWNSQIISALLDGARKGLLNNRVKEENIEVLDVPGSFEVPFAVQGLCAPYPNKPKFDAVIAIGVLIKGETMHFEYIADAVSHGLMNAQMSSNIPVIFGILTVLNEEQALARAGLGAGGHNHGEDWGAAAVEMGSKKRNWFK